MAINPYTEIHVDFDEDGLFESGEEIADDVRYWSVDRGVDPAMHRAAAAVLRMEVNNFTHKYSPSNPDSPLYPFTLPGPLVRVRSGYPADSFTAESNVQLGGRTPDLAGSELGTWTATSSMWIKENQTSGVYEVVGITATGTNIGYLDYGEKNVKLASRIRRPDEVVGMFPYKQPLFTFRYVDSNNYSYVYLKCASTAQSLLLCAANVVSGTDTEIDTVAIETAYGGGTVWNDGTFADVEVKVAGDTCEVYIFGTSAFAHQFTSITNLTGTKHGIGGAGFTSGTEAATSSAGQEALWADFGLLTQFYGRVDTVDPQTSHEDKVAYIRAFDDMERMLAFNLFTGSPTPPATAGDIAERILDRANFTRGHLLDDGTTLTVAAADSTQDTRKVMAGSALDELYQLADDEVGLFYLDRAGVAHFEAADHRELNDHDTPISIWDDNSAADKYWIPPLQWDDGKEGVENQIFYTYYRQRKTVSQTVWDLQDGDDPQFDFTNRVHPNFASFGLVDIVTIGDGDAVANPLVPIPGTNYTIDENADGTGQDWLTSIASNTGTVTMVNGTGGVYTLDDTGQDFTADVTVAGRDYDIRLGFIVIQDSAGAIAVASMATTDPDGDGTKVSLIKTPESVGTAGLLAVDEDFNSSLTLTYNVYLGVAYPLVGFEGNFQFLRFLMHNAITLSGSTATTAYVTSANLTADKLDKSDPSAARAEDSTSQNTYGLRRVNHESKHIADWTTAIGRAEKRLELRKDARERVGVKMQNSTKENLMEILYRDVSDRITIVYDDMGIDRDHFIENYRMEFERGNVIRMRWELTRVVPDDGRNYYFDDDAALFDTAVFAPPE